MARYKLLYIWVNDNDRLKNKEFHFNSKFHFSFNMKSCELSVTGPETSYIDGFYSIENETDNSESPNQEQGGFDPIENETDSSKSPNQEQNFNSIIDFSAIVGNNAVGKTTLLNLIHKYASKIGGIEKDAPSNFSNYELSQLFSHQIIMVYLDLDSIEKPLYAIPYNVKVTNSGKTITIIEKLPGLRPQTVYLTNTFNYSDYVKAQHFHDDFNLATGYLMFSFAEPHKTEFTTDPIIRFEHKEILRQSAVIRSVNEDKNFSDALKKIGLNIPKRTVFVLKHYHWDGNDFPGIDFDLESPEERDDLRIKAVNLKESLNTCAKHSYSNLGFPNNDNANITINLCHVLIQSLIVSISKAESSISKNVLIISHEYWKDYSSIIESHYKEIEDAVAFVKSYFKKLQNDFKYKDVVSTIIDNHMNFLDVFIKWIDHRFDTHDSITPQICIRTPNYISRTDFEDLDLEDYHYTSKNDLFSVTLFGVSIEEFIKEYDKISSYFASFSFSWEGLSSGESAFLSLFGRLFSIREKIIGNNNLILLLDEADMLFHPEWQRNYIEILHKVIPIIFPNKNIQVILATHSPLMLSDIPKQNTLFLQKDKDTGITEAIEGEDTFAANIFSLLRNAFFLEKCGMGEYSFNKIEWLINQIHNPKANPKEIFKYIDSVGDPYLKDKLLLEYYSGHGCIIDDVFYFVATDSNDSKETMISLDDVLNIINSVEKRNVSIWIDACRKIVKTKSVNEESFNFKKTYIEKSRGMGIIYSCSKGEYSLDSFNDKKISVFTSLLIDTLKGCKTALKNNRLTVRSMFDYIYDESIKASKENIHINQHPEICFEGSDIVYAALSSTELSIMPMTL